MDNLIDFSKFATGKQSGIDIEAAKIFFVNEVLPYTSEASLERLIKADFSGDSVAVKLEFMRMFVESELMRPTTTEENSLRSFFAASRTTETHSDDSEK